MFRSGNEDDTDECPCREDIRESLRSFHSSLLVHCKMPEMIEEETQPEPVELPKPSLRERLMALVGYAKQLEKKTSDGTKSRPGVYFNGYSRD